MWTLSFISEEDFTKHVKKTIEKYGEKLESFDLKRFNKNIIDPIKLIFDKTVYQASWEEIVSNEIFRQRDKSNNNDIGYFHQRIFNYIDKCHVPDNGKEGGWDVIFENPDGIALPDGSVVHTVYVEMKNKHNTMNSASAGKTFIKMQNQLLNDDDCACFLVDADGHTWDFAYGLNWSGLSIRCVWFCRLSFRRLWTSWKALSFRTILLLTS